MSIAHLSLGKTVLLGTLLFLLSSVLSLMKPSETKVTRSIGLPLHFYTVGTITGSGGATAWSVFQPSDSLNWRVWRGAKEGKGVINKGSLFQPIPSALNWIFWIFGTALFMLIPRKGRQ